MSDAYIPHIVPAPYFRALADFEPPNPPPPPGSPLADHLFPHLYGSLNRDAIVEVRAARRTGRFSRFKRGRHEVSARHLVSSPWLRR